MTRLKERGWPKTRGLLRRRKVITEEAVIAATEDAIRIAITIGGSLPEIARAIAITCMDSSDEPFTREAVEKWIDDGSMRGDEKMIGPPGNNPEWLKFRSITAGSSEGEFQVFTWTGDNKDYTWEDTDVIEMLKISTALAVIAMCWTLRHPDKAESLFTNPGAEAMYPELKEYITGSEAYSSWLLMAKELVSRYSGEVGFPKYEDLA
jgi:hypothetical protein